MKRFAIVFSFMFCLLFALNLNTKAAVSGDYEYTVNNSGITITKYNGTGKEVLDRASITIPTTIDGKIVTEIGDSAFYQCYGLVSVIIPDTVTTIGDKAFYYCGLKNITISSNIKQIGKRAFFQCTSLTSVTIPNGATEIGEATFEYCFALKNVDIPDSVKVIGDYAFCQCENLTSVTIPNSVVSLGKGAFEYCKNLKSLKLSNSLTTINDRSFHGCDSLASITIPKSVTTIGYNAFADCYNVLSLELHEGLKTIKSDAFRDLSITNITIPKSVTEIGFGAIGYCKEILSIQDNGEMQYRYIPISGFIIKGYDNSAGETYIKKYEKEYGFQFVSLTKRVTSVIISGNTHEVLEGNSIQLTSKVTPNDAENKQVTWSSSNTNVATVSQSGLVNVKAGTAGKSVTIKATANDRSQKSASWTITSKAVKKAASNEVKVNSTQTVGQNKYVVTTKSTVSYKAPVSKQITSIKIPKSININGKTYKVTAIENKAFYGCKKLKSVVIKSPVKKIGKYAFYKCKKLKTIRIYSIKLKKSNVLTGAFKGISPKATFYVPEGKKSAYKKILLKRGATKKMKFKFN